MALRLFSRKKEVRKRPGRGWRKSALATAYEPAAAQRYSDHPLERLVQLRRYGILAADPNQWKEQPGFSSTYERVLEAIDDSFGYVPEGYASIPQTIQDAPGCAEQDFDTNPYLLARHCVTHAEYQSFVDDDGYENLDLWPEDIWPHLIDFKDLTACAGPRYWKDGRHDKRYERHPVVGISFYEAGAFARWAGYRLPSEAEWQMAASWRIRSSAQTIRRYPWGDALNIRHCNVWASSIGQTLPVDACATGAAPNGVMQLVGNVWEWTACDFTACDSEGRNVVGDMVLKAIRGGAFDTYFPAQATSVFRTGSVGLARVHNIGFRCALDLPSDDEDGEQPPVGGADRVDSPSAPMRDDPVRTPELAGLPDAN